MVYREGLCLKLYPDPMPVSISVYTGYTLQCALCIHCSGPSVAPVYQCTVLVHVQYTLATLDLGLGIYSVVLDILVCKNVSGLDI